MTMILAASLLGLNFHLTRAPAAPPFLLVGERRCDCQPCRCVRCRCGLPTAAAAPIPPPPRQDPIAPAPKPLPPEAAPLSELNAKAPSPSPDLPPAASDTVLMAPGAPQPVFAPRPVYRCGPQGCRRNPPIKRGLFRRWR